MTNTAFSTLSAEWQLWITDNLARGCEVGGMADVMVRDGGFSKMLADAAIADARRAGTNEPHQAAAAPDINTSSNTLITPDRAVHVLTAFRSPRIVVLGNVLSDEECDALCAYTESKLKRSPVVGDADGDSEVHAHRTSQGAMLDRGETELIARIDARLAAIANWPIDNGEGLQVVRYQIGNEYRAHYDWFDPEQPGPRKHLERGGQRVGTFILYLCDVEQGGGTAFPNIGLEVQPRKGNALFFRNTNVAGAPDRETLHAGMPVITGTKFIANKWLRESAY